MDYINDIFKRLDLQQIKSFLLYGDAVLDEENLSYKERLENSCAPIYDLLEGLANDDEEYEKASDYLSQALLAYENVYM